MNARELRKLNKKALSEREKELAELLQQEADDKEHGITQAYIESLTFDAQDPQEVQFAQDESDYFEEITMLNKLKKREKREKRPDYIHIYSNENDQNDTDAALWTEILNKRRTQLQQER